MKLENFKTQEDFRGFLRKEGITLKTYFLTYYAKKDPMTGELLPYESQEKYLMRDFLNKKNLALWLQKSSHEVWEKYLNEKFEFRAARDNWVKAPSQVALRSVQELPAVNIMLDIGYQMPLPIHYDYNIKLEKPKSKLELIVDTREQKPLNIKGADITLGKLLYGDYSCSGKEFNSIFIERKSIEDLWGTMGKGYERFQKEMARAAEDGAYIVVLVEYPIYTALSYNHSRKYSTLSAEFIFKRIREMMQLNNNVQFAFTKSRKGTEEMIKIIYANSKKIRHADLQYIIDTKGVEI
jgi:hypothetical protein